MLLYKVIFIRKDQKEILYQSISSKVKLPPIELIKSEVGAMLIITTCDSSALDDEEVRIYHSEALRPPAVA